MKKYELWFHTPKGEDDIIISTFTVEDPSIEEYVFDAIMKTLESDLESLAEMLNVDVEYINDFGIVEASV